MHIEYDMLSEINNHLSPNSPLDMDSLEQKIHHNNNKPIVVVFTNQYIIGGIERVISSVLGKLCDNYTIVFVTFEYDNSNAYPISDDVNIISFSTENYQHIVNDIVCLCKYFEIDVFIGLQNMLPEPLTMYEKLAEVGITTISSNHCDFLFATKISGSVNGFPEIILKRREAYKNNFCSIWKNKRSAIIADSLYENAIYLPNPLPFEGRKELNGFGKNILALGRMDDPLKRIDITLYIMKMLHARDKEATLTIVGPINNEQKYELLGNRTIPEYVNHEKLEDCVKFVGQQNNVEEFYKKSDVLMITSATEGFGMTIIEAFSFGLPVVAFDVSSLCDLISDNNNGFLIKYLDFDSYCSTIIRIITDSDLQLRLKKGSLNSAEKYRIDAIVEKWKQIIDCSIDKDYKMLSTLRVKEGISGYINNIVNEYEDGFIDYTNIINSKEKEIAALESNINDMKKDNRKKLQKLVDYYCNYGLLNTFKRILHLN